MTDLTLKQLRYFESLAMYRHFGKAASACAISQPALSMQIQDLEKAVGTMLFERSTRELKLTSFGAEFLKRAVHVLRSADELQELARASGDFFSGKFRIGIIPTIAPYLLPNIISMIGVQYPRLEVHIRETQTQKLIEELTSGAIDAAIVALPVPTHTFEETILFDEEFVLVRTSKDADKPVPSADSLREMKLLLLEEGHCFRDQALSFCEINDGKPREVLDGSSLSTLVQMVGAGLGVTLIPEMAVNVETRSAAVSTTRFNQPKPKRTVGMIWRKTNPLTNQFREIASVVKSSGENNFRQASAG